MTASLISPFRYYIMLCNTYIFWQCCWYINLNLVLCCNLLKCLAVLSVKTLVVVVLRISSDCTADWPTPMPDSPSDPAILQLSSVVFPNCNFLLNLWLQSNIWWFFSTQFTIDLWSFCKLKNTFVFYFAKNLTRLCWASSAVTSDIISVNKDETAALLSSSALMHSVPILMFSSFAITTDIFLCFPEYGMDITLSDEIVIQHLKF